MPSIVFNITKGQPPFTAEVLNNGVPIMYIPTTGTWTIDVPEREDKTYTIKVTDAKNCVVEFIASCQEITTTEATTTEQEITTTLPEPEFLCNFQDFFYVSEETEFVTENNWNLGADAGWVQLAYNIHHRPIKIVVEYLGSEVINTGYVGDIAYQNALDIALTNLGEPTEAIVPIKQGIKMFFKSLSDPASAVLKIYSPIVDATMVYELRCPADEIYKIVFEDYVCVEVYVEEPVTTTEQTTEELTTTSELTTTEEEELEYRMASYVGEPNPEIEEPIDVEFNSEITIDSPVYETEKYGYFFISIPENMFFVVRDMMSVDITPEFLFHSYDSVSGYHRNVLYKKRGIYNINESSVFKLTVFNSL